VAPLSELRKILSELRKIKPPNVGNWTALTTRLASGSLKMFHHKRIASNIAKLPKLPKQGARNLEPNKATSLRKKTLLSCPKRAGKREAIESACVAPTYVEADCKVVATTVRASRSINGRIENRSSARAVA
jgi:hypothetical protein